MRRVGMPKRWEEGHREPKGLEPPDGLWGRAMLGPRREPPPAHRTWRGDAPVRAGLAVGVVGGPPGLVRGFGPAGSPAWSGCQHQARAVLHPQIRWSMRVPEGAQVAWAVVRSVRFPVLRESLIWHGPYYVLGRASRYPTGSVTTFPAASLPSSYSLSADVREGFFLIHAPRAFYVIHRLFQKPVKPFTKCALAFDRKAFQFFFPGPGPRWNRFR